MAFISTVPEAEARGAVAEMYTASQKNMGYLPNYTQLFSHRPDVMTAWSALLSAVRSQMDTRRYELVTLAAARTLSSSYCMLAHASVLKNQGIFSDNELAAIAQDFSTAVLTPAEQTMMAYAEKVVRDATQITQEDINQLKAHGFSDDEIFDITTTATVRCFFSKTLDALGATADDRYLDLDDSLRQALVVGRPITQP
jgi:uncharacterized peroxidase-related enzyme